jgi:antitoxin component HigA of HigAB toxin-antitoxin module
MLPEGIKNNKQYQVALERIYQLMQKDIQPDSPESDELEALSILVKDYEKIQYPIPKPNSLQAIKFGMGHVQLNCFISLQKKAESILGNAFEFEKWLHTLTSNNNDLSSLLSTPEGVETLSNELDRIAEGYPA